MKTRLKIGIGSAIATSAIIMIIVSPLGTALPLHPCQLGVEVPKADALIASQTIGEIHEHADVIAVGTITESFTWCFGSTIVTYMTLEVEEYLKNPLDIEKIRLKSLGGDIGAYGVWVEDEIIFDRGERVLVFLQGPKKDNTFEISPFSISVLDRKSMGNDLIKGIELRADEHRVTLSKGESGNITLLLDSFFGYDKMTPLSVSGFVFYDSETGDDTLYEDPLELEQFGIRIESTTITPIVNDTTSFDLPITVDANAKEGKYFVSLEAQAGGQMGSIQYASWKNSHKQIQITVENEN